MNHKLFGISIVLSLLTFACIVSTVFASSFVPLEWQQETMVVGELQRKHVKWMRDIDGDFLDDALDELQSGMTISVIIQFQMSSTPLLPMILPGWRHQATPTATVLDQLRLHHWL